jgi:hypothetical protein
VGYQHFGKSSPWRQRQEGPSNHWYPTTILHNITTHKTLMWMKFGFFSTPTNLSSCKTQIQNYGCQLTWGKQKFSIVICVLYLFYFSCPHFFVIYVNMLAVLLQPAIFMSTVKWLVF